MAGPGSVLASRILLLATAGAFLVLGAGCSTAAGTAADASVSDMVGDAPSLPDAVTDAASDLPDASPDTPIADPGADPDAAVTPEDSAADAPPDDGPEPPLAIPYVTPPAAHPVEDTTFLQELNSNPFAVEPGIGALRTVLVPPAGVLGYDLPTQVTPRGLVTHPDGATPLVLAIPPGDPDLVGAAFLADGVVLAGPRALYDRGTDALAARDVPGLAAAPASLAGFVQGHGRALVWSGPDAGLLAARDAIDWRTGTGIVTAVADSATHVAVARLDPAAAGGVSIELLPQEAFLPVGAAPPPSAALDPTVDPGTGPVRALVVDVALPAPLDLVAIGDSGIAGFRVEDGRLVPVDVPLFAAGRVPLAGALAAVRTSDGGFAAACDGGVLRVVSRELGPEWRVYNGLRWVPSEDVRGLATDAGTPDSPLYLATAGGLATVTAERLTIGDKIARIIERVELRHDRDGAVADSRLSVPGDLSTSIPWDSDNDGGWTCYWVLSECFRWKVTGDAGARANFDRSLERMLSLRTLTGTDWFVARSVIRKATCNLDDCDDPDDGEWFTSPDGEWWVKSDTSNDEVTSHMFMMAHAYELCADAPQREAIRDHVRGIVGGIVDHGFQLLKPDGEVTTYGQFDPEYVNGFVGMVSDGGRRSVQLLAAIDLALALTGEDRFRAAKETLVRDHHYDENVVTESEAPGRRGSGDGDELAMQAFFVLLRYESDPGLAKKFREGWRRTYANIRLQEAALWDVVNGVLGGEDPRFDNALRWLRAAPLDGIRWPVHNLHRLDLADAPAFYDIPQTVRRQRSDGHPVPPDERPNIRHNTSQYEVEGGWGANTEIDGADIAAAYWMARYHGFILP